MKDLKVTLHFSEKIHKEFFLGCLEEKSAMKKPKNRVMEVIDHYRIEEVTELDGSVHYSNHRGRHLMTDAERDRFLKKIIDQSAERIQNEFFGDLVKKLDVLKDEFLLENCLKDAIHRQISSAFDYSLLQLRMKQLEEEV